MNRLRIFSDRFWSRQVPRSTEDGNLPVDGAAYEVVFVPNTPLRAIMRSLQPDLTSGALLHSTNTVRLKQLVDNGFFKTEEQARLDLERHLKLVLGAGAIPLVQHWQLDSAGDLQLNLYQSGTYIHAPDYLQAVLNTFSQHETDAKGGSARPSIPVTTHGIRFMHPTVSEDVDSQIGVYYSKPETPMKYIPGATLRNVIATQ